MNCGEFLQHTVTLLVILMVNFFHTFLVISMVDWGEFHEGLMSEKIVVNFYNTLLVILKVNFYNTLLVILTVNFYNTLLVISMVNVYNIVDR